MRREVTTLLSNEKFTYIEFQGDLWVTLTFGFSYSQSVLWNFSSLNLQKFGRYEDSSHSSFIYLHKIYSYF
jgi:hypothetical protein